MVASHDVHSQRLEGILVVVGEGCHPHREQSGRREVGGYLGVLSGFVCERVVSSFLFA